MTVEGDRLPPDADLGLYLFSDPVLLATVHSSVAGSIRATVTIPADTALGAHEIGVVDSGGRVLAKADLQVVRGTTTATTTVTRTGGPLPRTGLRTQTLGLLALLFVLLGALVLRSPELVRPQRRWPNRPRPQGGGTRRPRW